MTLGMIVRGDRGGLATMTHEAWRHLHPDVTVLVDLGRRGRGPCDRSLYPDAVVVEDRDPFPAHALAALDSCDVVWSAEVWYHGHAKRWRPAGYAVLHSMPELSGEYPPADRVLHPTGWLMPPGGWLVPVPAPTDRIHPADPGEQLTVVFQDAGAMLDRAGGGLVAASLRHVTRPMRLVVRNPLRPWRSTGRVTVEVVAEAEHWSQWPAGHVLVAPRRYGGLSLPVQEAAAAGMAVVCLDSDPYAAEPFTASVAALPWRGAVMGGRRIPVWTCSPRRLAAALDRLDEDRAFLAELRAKARRWAEERSWPQLLPVWREALAP